MTTNLFKVYESELSQSRNDFKQKITLLHKKINRDNGLLFLIYFCAQGIKMTDQVGNWILSSGQKCLEMGYESLGKALLKHAKEESGHDILMRNDVYALVELMQKETKINIEAESFLNNAMTKSVLSYKKLHEDCIASATPYGQIAIEFEIERVSIKHGPKVIFRVLKEYGFKLLKCLSFIKSHVKLDILHTKFNKKTMQEFLIENPEALAVLIQYGKLALENYYGYLQECYELAEEMRRKINASSHSSDPKIS